MLLHHQKNSVSLTQAAQAVQGQKSIIIFTAAELKLAPCVDLLGVSTTSVCLLYRRRLLLLRLLFGVMAVFRRWPPPVVLVFSPQGEDPPGTQRGCPNSYDGGIILEFSVILSHRNIIEKIQNWVLRDFRCGLHQTFQITSARFNELLIRSFTKAIDHCCLHLMLQQQNKVEATSVGSSVSVTFNKTKQKQRHLKLHDQVLCVYFIFLHSSLGS